MDEKNDQIAHHTYGREIAKESDRENQKRMAELNRVIAEDRIWLRALADAAEFHEACARAPRKMTDEHFGGR